MPVRLLVAGAAAAVSLFASQVLPSTHSENQRTLARDSGVNRVVVDPAAVRRTIPSTFFGINYLAFWDKAQGSPASARALAQTPIRSLRFPGGVTADYFDWQDPYYKKWSLTDTEQAWKYLRSFGGTHMLLGTDVENKLPPPTGKSYAANSPENAAAWAQWVKTHGISADFEVGNEEDMALMHKHDDPAFNSYIDAFNAQARAMHHVDPHLRIVGPAGVNEYYWWALDSLGMFLGATGNRGGSGQADGASLHFYKGSSWFDSRGVAQYWLAHPWPAVQTMIRQHVKGNFPVYVTEWNLGPSDQNNAFNPTLGHGLAVADMVGALATSGVKAEYYWTIHGGTGWGLLYGLGEKRPVDTPTPAYYAMALWKHMGSKLLKEQQSDDPSAVMSTYATRGAHGAVQILAINKQRSARTIAVTFRGATPAKHHLSVYSLAGATGNVDDLDAVYDGRRMPSPQSPLPAGHNLGIIRGNRLVYHVPAYSAVVLNVSGLTADRSIRPASIPTATPLPPAKFTATGSVSASKLLPGQTQQLSAVVQSSEDLGPAMVDLEVYNSIGAKVFQTTQQVTVSAGQPITVSRSFTLPSGATGGTYSFRVGLFGTSWTPKYVWNDKAATFTVDGPPAPHIAISGTATPSHVRAGQTATVHERVTNTGGALANAIVDAEVYSASGQKVCGPIQSGVSVPAGGSIDLTLQCAVAATQAPGTYYLKMGVFAAGWTFTYAYTNAGTLTVDP